MKRYLAIIICIIFTIVVITTFYIKTVIAGGDFPEYVLEKVSGDESLTEQLVLYGDYVKDSQYESFRIINNESFYNSELSIFEKAIGVREPIFDKWIKEHRNFMRGKDLFTGYFYEDEQQFVYANLVQKGNSKFIFDIAALNKKNNEKASFTMDLQENSKIGYAQVLDVQVNNDNQVQVIVQNYYYNEGDNQEYRLYTFDIGKKKLIGNELIASVDTGAMGWNESYFANNEEYTGRNQYLVLKRYASDQKYGEYGEPVGEPIVLMDDYVIFNTDTFEKETITIPEEMAVSGLSVNQSTIYFSETNEDGLKVVPYDIESKSFGTPVVFGKKSGIEQVDMFQLYQDKIYIVHSNPETSKETWITIGSLDSGKILYEGKIKEKSKANKDDEAHTMNISDLSVYE
ncbi:hypothetical protein OEV98_15440 [Caldibacillus lycopersici]|uniref:Uncharacterized protein n=1 Tax=Perspicuibacillus lycopersici TaxID=1325689 RepID=A0AAE3LU14_9BACI|nr:hypothetical protein [Perspicuibacillus lycopersici]MCU9614938.1 hypothetical protein [Perspicuibacillus lycopersici]